MPNKSGEVSGSSEPVKVQPSLPVQATQPFTKIDEAVDWLVRGVLNQYGKELRSETNRSTLGYSVQEAIQGSCKVLEQRVRDLTPSDKSIPVVNEIVGPAESRIKNMWTHYKI